MTKKKAVPEDFVSVLREMTREERLRFLVKYVGRYRVELDKARKSRQLILQLFDSGCCPHCKAKLF